LGVSPFMENVHIQVMLKRPICRPTGFVKSRENVGLQTSFYKKNMEQIWESGGY
jgi:hypothetical protein